MNQYTCVHNSVEKNKKKQLTMNMTGPVAKYLNILHHNEI